MASLSTLCLCMTCLGVAGASFEVTILRNVWGINDGLIQCAKRGLQMTSYRKEERETVEEEMRKQNIRNAWLPVKKETWSSFRWIDKTNESSKKWGPGKDCGTANLEQHTIDKTLCHLSKKSICEYKGLCNSSSKTPNSCREIEGRMYSFTCEEHGWYTARTICKSQGGDLVVSRDIKKLSEITKALQPSCKVGDYIWLGLHKSTWYYRRSGKEEFYGEWGEGEPSTNGSCAIIQEKNGNFIVKVEDCKNRHPVICVRKVQADQEETSSGIGVSSSSYHQDESSSGVGVSSSSHHQDESSSGVGVSSSRHREKYVVAAVVVIVLAIVTVTAVCVYRRKRRRAGTDGVVTTENKDGDDRIPLQASGIVIDTSSCEPSPNSPGPDTFHLLRPNRPKIPSIDGYERSPYNSRESLLDDNNTWVIDSNGGEYKHNDEEVTVKVPSGAILKDDAPRSFRAEAEVDIYKHLTIGEEGRIISPVLKYQHGPLFHDLLTIDILHRVTHKKLLQGMQAYYKRRDVSDWQDIQSKKKRRSSQRDAAFIEEEDGEKEKKLVPDMYFEVTKSDVKIYTNQLGYFKVTCPAPLPDEMHLIGMIYADVNEDVSEKVSQEITVTVIVLEEMYNKKAIKMKINEKYGGNPIQDNISLTIKKDNVAADDKLRFVLKPEKEENWVLHEDQENEIQEKSLLDISQEFGERFDVPLTTTLIQNQGKQKTKTFLMHGNFLLLGAKDSNKCHTLSKAVKCRVSLRPVEDDYLLNAENESSGRGSSISTVHNRVVRPTGYHRFDRQFSQDPH